MPEFCAQTKQSSQWSIERPFFAVPPGKGGLTGYRDAAAKHGVNLYRDIDRKTGTSDSPAAASASGSVNLYRDIDRKTGAKTVFAKSSIPGSVGSGACAFWQELGPLLQDSGRAFRVWPFEGDLPALLESSAVVLGETYPRAAYATALLEGPAQSRRPLVVAKTKAPIRKAAIAVLRSADWVRHHGVTLENLAEAEAGEDDFDACLTAAALLCCELEGLPLYAPRFDGTGVTGGGILGTGSIEMGLPARTFAAPCLPLPLPFT